MEKTQKKRRVRELTKNEKVLLTLLGIVILFWLSYRFIYIPQTEKLESLEIERMEYELAIEDINTTLRKEKSINKEWEELNAEKERIVSSYFPILDQAQIIYLLNELTAHDDVDIKDLSFSRPSMTDFQDFQVNSMDVSIPYSGGYDGVIDVLNAIKGSPRKITVDNLSMDRTAEEGLSGNMALRVYSLDGIAESDPEVIYVDTVASGTKETPFGAFESFADSETESGDEGSSGRFSSDDSNDGFGSEYNEDDYIRRVVLNDFEGSNYDFIPSSILVKGNISSSRLAKSGKSSLRMEYNIVAIEDENRIYVNIEDGGNVLKYPPHVIGMWVHSYGYSPGTIGLTLRGQMGEEIEVVATEGVNWMGWEYLEASFPTDISLYPLTVDKLYFEIPDNREDYGVLNFDRIEAVYPKGEDEMNNGDDSSYFFHVVQKGDTVEKISQRYYGTVNYKSEIMGLNDMYPGDILPEGKVLVMKRR